MKDLLKEIKIIKLKNTNLMIKRSQKRKNYFIKLFFFSIIIIILLILFIKYIIFKYRTNNIIYSTEYIYCYNCAKNITSECDKECPPEVLFKNLKIASNFDTLDEIIKNNKSISRFGDGEYRLLLGMRHGFTLLIKTYRKTIRSIK